MYYLTDSEVIETYEELMHPHTHRGMEVIEMALLAFPDELRLSMSASQIDEDRKRLKENIHEIL